MAIGDFEKAKTSLQEKINEAEQEGEISANFTEFESLKQQMADLEAKKSTYDGVVENAEAGATENQVAQVTDLGGSEEELNKRLEEKNEGVEKIAGGAINYKNVEEPETSLRTEKFGIFTERIRGILSKYEKDPTKALKFGELHDTNNNMLEVPEAFVIGEIMVEKGMITPSEFEEKKKAYIEEGIKSILDNTNFKPEQNEEFAKERRVFLEGKLSNTAEGVKEYSKEEASEMIEKYKIVWKGQLAIENSYNEYMKTEIMPLQERDKERYNSKRKEYFDVMEPRKDEETKKFIKENGGKSAFELSSKILGLRKQFPEIPETSDELLNFSL